MRRVEIWGGEAADRFGKFLISCAELLPNAGGSRYDRHMKSFRFLSACLVFSTLGPTAIVAQITLLDAPEIRSSDHDVFENEDISAIAIHGDRLAFGADEKSSIQFFDPVSGEPAYEAREPTRLFDNSDEELDIEGIARSGDTWFVAGSHSRKRKKVDLDDDNRKYRKNRERLTGEGLRDELFRNQILRFEYDPSTGQPFDAADVDDPLDLSEVFAQSPVLGRFTGLPSKENGIDIEGIATDGESIWLGFRGPVLRNNWVPVMRLKYDQPAENEILFVNLGGGGIREIAKCPKSAGFLLIAGAVGDWPLPYSLYHWDGADTLPGERSASDPPQGKVDFLGEIPAPPSFKAEGLAIEKETADFFEILVVYDGATDGDLKRFRVAKPQL
ncbi:MAG: DUF3616 domain-containing protein [Verrucomicrobiota bacterium]